VNPVEVSTPASPAAGARLRWLRWVAGAVLLVVIALAIVAEVEMHRAIPILKGRIVATLSARFNSKVELDSLDVSLVKGLAVSGGGLRIFAPDDVVAAGATNPIIAVKEFSFHAPLRDLFLKPIHIGNVDLDGLEIHIPPRQARVAGVPTHRRPGKIEIHVDHFLCEHSDLYIDNGNPDKEPKHFVLDRIELWEIGADAPWRYDATLVNAIPRGDIHTTGTFGPWITESPGDSSLTGHYTFDHADLGTIKGIGGTLSSVGDFSGQLDHIEVTGSTQTPNFLLDSANQPMPLATNFRAIVDGTTGDTYLTQVNARLRQTPIVCSGSVVNIRGKGHVIDLSIQIPGGSLQDLLGLAVKTRPVYLTASISTRAKLHIRPGPESVSQKLSVSGNFALQQVHFTNPRVQDKVDGLSMRAQGRPAEAKPGAPDVASQMTGTFNLAGGKITFDKLDYTLPGAEVQLAGIYSLNGEQFDFHGKVRTQAQVSQMVSSWWKQLLLKPVDRYFRKDGAGTEVPIRVSGTNNEPKFGLDFGHDREAKKP
jgi:hypothetical protein